MNRPTDRPTSARVGPGALAGSKRARYATEVPGARARGDPRRIPTPLDARLPRASDTMPEPHRQVDDSASLLEAIAECERRKNARHLATVHQRHDLIASYWFQCRLLEVPELGWRSDEALTLVCGLAQVWADRYDETTGLTPDHEALRRIIADQLGEITRAIDPCFAQSDREPTRDELDQAISQALAAIFRWDDLDRLAVYLYIHTNEVLPRASLKSEKSRVLAIIEDCRDQQQSHQGAGLVASTRGEEGKAP